MRNIRTLNILGALAVLATIGLPIALDTYPQTAHAQTQGMERRHARRATRHEARAAKHACNAAHESSRAGCRQEKRDVKQNARQGGSPAVETTTTPPH
jgi:hypothetical protein